jgi:drug/metabolite transporter (DMT)-like permease
VIAIGDGDASPSGGRRNFTATLSEADMRRLAGLAPLAAAAIWGGMYVVSKWGFSAIPPLALTFLRVVLGAAILLAVVRASKPEREFSRADWRGFGVLAGWLTLSLASQFVGTDLTNASQGSLVTILTPVFTLGFAVWLFGEPLTPRRAGGTALALVGTLVVVAGRYDLRSLAAGDVGGVGLLVLAGVTFAGYTVWGKPLIRRYSALEAATYATTLSVPLFGLLALAEYLWWDPGLASVPLTLPVVAAVLYLGVVSTALAWYLWYKGMEYVDAGAVAVFFFAQPVVGTALGALLLGERIGAAFVVGGALMAAGVYRVATDRASTAEPSESEYPVPED